MKIYTFSGRKICVLTTDELPSLTSVSCDLKVFDSFIIDLGHDPGLTEDRRQPPVHLINCHNYYIYKTNIYVIVHIMLIFILARVLCFILDLLDM